MLWFYLPGRGRYIFSIIPYEGYPFQNIGKIENNKISFSLDGDLYEWISSSPIIGDGGNWQIWVLRDSSYRPEFEVGWSEEKLSSEEKAELEARFNLKSEEELKEFLSQSRYLIGSAESIEFLLEK